MNQIFDLLWAEEHSSFCCHVGSSGREHTPGPCPLCSGPALGGECIIVYNNAIPTTREE